MKPELKPTKSNDEIKISRLTNLLNIKNAIIKHKDGDYGLIPSEFSDLTNNRGLWITDDGVEFSREYNEGITFKHYYPLLEKGIFLNHPLKGDFTLKFKLNYQVIVNFYLGTDHLVNFRNRQLKNDLELKTNVWHDMEFTREGDVVSIKADGSLVRTATSKQELFVIRIYNSDRRVSIKEFYAKVEPETGSQ